ncbi:hypothetical protein RJ639_039388 [Escallonia herrerae]|uniref:Late embryogenesis abundant protein LEA-2 subgroup domain-containing protein n=1 Tax=Escallonia herrerae TaxID=1293975 RepID=A0AA89B6C5_9ASTE|nr:hypothetical protein RJ639_039388 [Escallonia herrerae]
MASVTDDERDKPVTGYPSQNPRVVTGYPHATTASAPPPSSVYTTAAPYYYFQPQPQPLPQPLPHPHPHPHQHHNHYRQDDDVNDNHRDRPQNHRAHRDQSARFLCRLLAALLIVFLAMGVVSFAAWLVLRPHLPEFRLASVTASPFNATASSLSATWRISFLVTNPNHKLGIYYDRLDASVFYNDDYLLSRTSLPPFFQLKDNQTLINAKLGVVESNMENDVVKGISSDRPGGRVKFSFRAMAVIRYRSGEWRTTKHLIRVYCEGVEIGFTSNFWRSQWLFEQEHERQTKREHETLQLTRLKAGLFGYSISFQRSAAEKLSAFVHLQSLDIYNHWSQAYPKKSEFSSALERA